MPEDKDITDQLNALRENYKLTLSVILDELEQTVSGLDAKNVRPETLSRIHFLLHRVTGSGATFGFPALSGLARSLETQAEQWLAAGKPIDAANWSNWRASTLALRQTAALPAKQEPAVSARPLAKTAGADRRVGLVLFSDDTMLSEELASGLGQFGYEVSCFPTTAENWETSFSGPPELVMLDIPGLSHEARGESAGVPKLFEQIGGMVPTVFLSGNLDFSSKLAAASVGAGALLPRGIDVPLLAAHIESLLKSRYQMPFRVLIVDDDELLAEHYRLTLITAGMKAERVSRPMDVLAAIEKLRPDLVLLDLYMPECSGAVLARAIRYEEAWQSLPIVYLSAEADLDLQVQALSSGADDFLTKPISDGQLVATVRVRAERARKLSDLVSQDSLTGLLKHASIKERLVQEVDRARRQAKSLCAVMVDIDHFKKVNDTWGHPMGDQVIKTLAHLLRQRLRRQDSIGRYGGEEFLAVLTECSAEDALRLLEDVRQRFGEIRFTHGSQHFNVTLSVGVACNDFHATPGELLAAADGALYAAKHGGRNQVKIAESPTEAPEVAAQRVVRKS